jgi:hypothetical protein
MLCKTFRYTFNQITHYEFMMQLVKLVLKMPPQISN